MKRLKITQTVKKIGEKYERLTSHYLANPIAYAACIGIIYLCLQAIIQNM